MRFENWYLALHDRLVLLLLWLAVALERHRTLLPGAVRRLRGSLRRLLPRASPRADLRRHRSGGAWNRTLPAIEERLRELKAAHPHLGNGTLARLLERLTRVRVGRETVRRILKRPALAQKPLKVARRIDFSGPRRLWRIDRTLVWLLGFRPVWILGAVDCHGSRIVCLDRLRAPTSAGVQRVLARVFEELEAPARLLSDNGMVFRSFDIALMLSQHGVEHTFTRPRRPQGRSHRAALSDVQGDRVHLDPAVLEPLADRSVLRRFPAVLQPCQTALAFRWTDTPRGLLRAAEAVLLSRPVQSFDGGFLWHEFG